MLSDYNRVWSAEYARLCSSIAEGKNERRHPVCSDGNRLVPGKNCLSCCAYVAAWQDFPSDGRPGVRSKSAPHCIQNKHCKVSLDYFGMGENNTKCWVYPAYTGYRKTGTLPSLICGIDNDAAENRRTSVHIWKVSMKEECRCLRKVWRQEKSVIFYGLWEWICFRDTIWLCRHKYKKRACESTFFFLKK